MVPIVSEFIGTLALFASILLVKGSIQPVVVGATLAALISLLGPISGAHLNPAVTIGLLVAGKISVAKAFLYIGAQVAGALSAYAALLVVSL